MYIEYCAKRQRKKREIPHNKDKLGLMNWKILELINFAGKNPNLNCKLCSTGKQILLNLKHLQETHGASIDDTNIDLETLITNLLKVISLKRELTNEEKEGSKKAQAVLMDYAERAESLREQVELKKQSVHVKVRRIQSGDSMKPART